MANQRLYPFWGNLTEALHTGQPQNEAKSGEAGFFEALYADPARLEQFLAAMTGISQGANLTIARTFPWAGYRTFVDVGTAQGDLAAQIAVANPHLRGTGFDLPRWRPSSRSTWQGGLADRLAFQPGSFFNDPLPKADVVLMGHILHDWDLHQADADRKGVRRGPGGRGAGRLRSHHRRRPIEERIRSDDEPQHADRNAGWLRLHRRRLRRLDEGAGFSSTRVEQLVGPDSMVIGIK